MKNFKKFIAPILVLSVFIWLAIAMPGMATRSAWVTWDYFKEMVLIMPPIFILMGLMEIWIPKNKIQKWLGSGSGIKGAGIAFALGTLPTGPLYVAFPMTAALIRKGASFRNMVLFLGSWSALKIPQLMIEIKFLGVTFALARFVLTILALALTGLLMETILSRHPDIAWLQKAENPEQVASGKRKQSL